MAIEKFDGESKSKPYSGLVISSIRHPWEVDRIHAHGGLVVWVDADARVRYNRIFNRGQGEKDQKTFEQFLAEEQTEKDHTGDQATLNWQGVKDRADIFITNDDNDLEKFKAAAQKALGL